MRSRYPEGVYDENRQRATEDWTTSVLRVCGAVGEHMRWRPTRSCQPSSMNDTSHTFDTPFVLTVGHV